MPGSSQKMLEKSRGLNVDCVAYDLEDSVAPGRKPEAREAVSRFLEQPRAQGIRENAVRINAVGSGLALDDLTGIVCHLEISVPPFQGLIKASSKPPISTPS